MPLVIDASVALAWTLSDEAGTAAATVLERVLAGGAVAPVLWSWEIQNALRSAERRRRITIAESTEAVENLRSLPIELIGPAFIGRDLEVARQHALTVYDAAYLELALRSKSPLATLDATLGAVARRLGILAAEVT